MTKKILFMMLSCFCVTVANAAESGRSDDFIPVDELIKTIPNNTECASQVFADALREHSDEITDAANEIDTEMWVHVTMARPEVLTAALDCPELATANDYETITFMPIRYEFPSGRELVINYETQPKVLRQRLLLATKRDLNSRGGPNPEIGGPDDDAIWTNTEPAWYAIMVTRAGALDDFVGPDKNNTISLKYIEENVKKLIPGGRCTDWSALSRDWTTINKALHRTADAQGTSDSNDYYVAGDKNLQWITYLEIAGEVVITVATYGGWAALAGVTKIARATKTLRVLGPEMRALSKTEHVSKYLNQSKKIADLTEDIKKLDKVKDAATIEKKQKELKTLEEGMEAIKKSDTAGDIKRYEDVSTAYKELNAYRHELQALRRMRKAPIKQTGNVVARKPTKKAITTTQKELNAFRESNPTVKKYLTHEQNAAKIQEKLKPTNLKKTERDKLTRQLKTHNQEMKRLEKTDDMKQFRQLEEAAAKNAPTEIGSTTKNVARAGRAIYRANKAALSGGGVLDKAEKVARSGMKSGKIRDWLYHSTMRNITKLGKLGAVGSASYIGLKFLGDMFDYSATSTDEFTSGIQFKPLLLLSADDIEGQENVVNHGMWFTFMGDSISPADDDAAFLQAMDFAEKFHQDLLEVQQEDGTDYCDVDIYVVRPVIRNPDAGENAELYYLIMNDQPWHVDGDANETTKPGRQSTDR